MGSALGLFPRGLAEGVRIAVAALARTANLTAPHVDQGRRVVGDAQPRARGGAVALHAVTIRKGLEQRELGQGFFERHLAVATEVAVHVVHAVDLGEHGTEHSVVGVAGVTALVAEQSVAAVSRGERLTTRVFGVAGVREHDVARATKVHGLGGVHARDVAREGGAYRQDAEAQEQPGLGREGKGWPLDEIGDDDNDRQSRTEQGERAAGADVFKHGVAQCTAGLCILTLFLSLCLVFVGKVDAQSLRSSAEAWGQTYRPAGLVNLEAGSALYPWIRAETQVWTGVNPYDDDGTGDVVVLAAYLREPTGHLSLRAGRFVLATGAVRPVHIDGGHVHVLSDWGSALEVFSGVPVVPRFDARPYDWLVGGRVSQRLKGLGVLGFSYVEQRDRGREINEEVGADLALYLTRWLTLHSRGAYDVVSKGLSEAQLTASLGTIERRVEAFASVRNAARILPATSLFSVLSDANSVQAGMSGRLRVAPRLRLESLAAYRGQGDEHGVRLRLGGTLALSDEGESAVEGAVTRDGVGESQWTGLRAMLIRDVLTCLRLIGELELVIPDHGHENGKVWPWGRVSARYTLLEHWQLSLGAEGSSSPQFTRLFQALFRVAYEFAKGAP